MVGLTAPTLSFALAYFITGRITTTQLRADRALYAGTLERYLAPQVIERIVEGGEPVEIGASAREITVLASDIADFSVLVGATEPALFSRLINGYFDGVIDILWRYEAMLDKLTGDGLIAIFGAPVEQPDHARRALDCALAIDQFSEAYRTAVASEHAISFGQTRIGIHTGPALVGNFGGERRFNYTAYGETVVIAARLEAANKSSGTRILASRETINRAGDYPKTRLIGDIELKGVAGAVGAFTIGQ
jgi:adenylate cyclase